MTALRPYQAEAVNAACAALEQHGRALAAMATGTGKTPVAAKAAERRRPLGPTLLLAPRLELIEQAAKKAREWTELSVGIEQAERSVAGADLPDIVVASVQTMCRPRRIAEFRSNAFATVIVDEAHHATAPSYRFIFDYFKGASLFGITATPDAGTVDLFGPPVFSMGLREGIETGYLAPISARSIRVESVVLDKVRTVAGDFVELDLAREFLSETALHAVARPTLEASHLRPTLVFAVSVEHARRLAELCNVYEAGVARYLSGKHSAEERAATLAAFTRGEFRVLVGCMLFTEGFDCPPISCIAIARPTQSRRLYAQMVGRGTRLAPGKDDLLLLDFTGEQQALAVDIFDLLADDAAAAARARADADCGDQAVNVGAAIKEAAAALALERARVEYSSIAYDPLVGVPWRRQPASEKQRAVLVRNGLDPNIDRGTAHKLIDEILERSTAGLCTIKMARVLRKHGLTDRLPFDQARAVIEAMRQNYWRVPAEFAGLRVQGAA